jgi:hypothetical protein
MTEFQTDLAREQEHPYYLPTQLSFSREQLERLEEEVSEQQEEAKFIRLRIEEISFLDLETYSAREQEAIMDAYVRQAERLPENNKGVYRVGGQLPTDLYGAFSADHPSLSDGIFWLRALNPTTKKAIIGGLAEQAGGACFAGVIDLAQPQQSTELVLIDDDSFKAMEGVVRFLQPRIETPALEQPEAA